MRPRRSTRRARSSRRASSTSTRTTTVRSAGTACWSRRAGTASPRSSRATAASASPRCGPGKEDWLIGLMEGVEDIPGTALTEGMTWGWESYPEYLDVIEKHDLAIDVGSQVAHGAVRAYAMGERGAQQRAGHARGHRGDGAHRAGGRRGRRARLLDVTHDRPPRHGRRAGSRHLCRRGRTVRPRPGDGRRRAGRLRAGPAGSCGRGHHRAEERAGVDAAPRRGDRPPDLVRHDPGRRGAGPLARTAGHLGGGACGRQRVVSRRSPRDRSACCSASPAITRSPIVRPSVA